MPESGSSRSRVDVPRPFVKWAGGKGQLLGEIEAALPSRFRAYHEPFTGGGAVFFHLWRAGYLQRHRAWLGDGNPALMHCYQTLRDALPQVVDELRELAAHHDADDPGYYYARRDEYNARPRRAARRAALFIYLNRTGFNGLYRVNRRGLFNVPVGRYRRPRILDLENLQAVAAALGAVELSCEDFASVLGRARKGDLVYFDPPYDPLSVSARFTSYTAEAFAADEQRRLAAVYGKLARRGCHVILSNAYTPRIRGLYTGLRDGGLNGMELRRVEAGRAINSRGDRRGPIPEYLIVHHA